MGATAQRKPRVRGLSTDAVVRAAVDLLEREGPEGFSLRRLGTAVGCDAMTITYRFGSKEGLNRAMADWLESGRRPVPPDASWRTRLRHGADQYRALALRYPRTFELLQRFPSTGSADHARTEEVHRALRDAGVPERDVPAVCLGWYAAVIGLAGAEVSGLIAPHDAQVVAEVEALPPESFALTKRLLPLYRDLAPSHVFATAVDMLLDGIAARAART